MKNAQKVTHNLCAGGTATVYFEFCSLCLDACKCMDEVSPETNEG